MSRAFVFIDSRRTKLFLLLLTIIISDLSFASNLQNRALTWTPQKFMENLKDPLPPETDLTYRLAYEIVSEDDRCDTEQMAKLDFKHFVDLGHGSPSKESPGDLEFEWEKDPHFQPGVRYALRLYSVVSSAPPGAKEQTNQSVSVYAGAQCARKANLVEKLDQNKAELDAPESDNYSTNQYSQRPQERKIENEKRNIDEPHRTIARVQRDRQSGTSLGSQTEVGPGSSTPGRFISASVEGKGADRSEVDRTGPLDATQGEGVHFQRNPGEQRMATRSGNMLPNNGVQPRKSGAEVRTIGTDMQSSNGHSQKTEDAISERKIGIASVVAAVFVMLSMIALLPPNFRKKF